MGRIKKKEFLDDEFSINNLPVDFRDRRHATL
jgi:hypothetical protein